RLVCVTKLATPSVPFQPGDDIASIIGRWARDTPSRPALVQGSRAVTWADFAGRVERIAAALTSKGVAKGSRIAVLAQNSIEHVEVFFGGLRAGASVVPLPTMASPASLLLMLADCGATILFVSAQYEALAKELDPANVELRIAFDFERDGFVSYDAIIG